MRRLCYTAVLAAETRHTAAASSRGGRSSARCWRSPRASRPAPPRAASRRGRSRLSSVSSETRERTAKPRAISSVSARASARSARSKSVARPWISAIQARSRRDLLVVRRGLDGLVGQLQADRQPGLQRIGFARASLLGHALEPAPAVADDAPGHGRGPGRTGVARRVLDAFDELPLLELGQGQRGRAVAEAQGLADVALGERAARDEQVAVHARDRGCDVPGGAHVAPGVGEGDTHVLGAWASRP